MKKPDETPGEFDARKCWPLGRKVSCLSPQMRTGLCHSLSGSL